MKDFFPIMTQEQKDIVGLLDQILKVELAPIIADCDKKGEYPIQVAQKLFEAGLYGVDIPQEYGGLGLDFKTCAMLYEVAARYDAGFAFHFFAGTTVVGHLLPWCAREEQIRMITDDMLNNHAYISFCLTEPDAGSDAGNVRTTYRQEGDEYVLNGTKCFVTMAPQAKYFIVAATKDRNLKYKGISLFLVEKERGVQVGKHEDKMGLRLSETADVILENIRVPKENLLGEEGKGLSYMMGLIDINRSMTMAMAVGIGQSALDHAVKYSKERVQFGVPIIKHQGHGFMLAEMQARIHAARSMVFMSADVLDAGKRLGTLAPSTKFFVSEEMMKVCIDAVQALGGYGYMRDYPVEKLMRDVKIFSIFEGTNQINRRAVASLLERQ